MSGGPLRDALWLVPDELGDISAGEKRKEKVGWEMRRRNSRRRSGSGLVEWKGEGRREKGGRGEWQEKQSETKSE